MALIKTGCQGICAGAPVISIHPEDIVYLSATAGDVPEIVESHLVGGEPVARLLLPPDTRRG